MENQLQTRNLNASSGYTTYYADAIGRNASNSGGAPFFLPDDEEGDAETSGDSEENLAQQYDLGRHLDSDRTTFSKTTAEPFDAVKTSVLNSDLTATDDDYSQASPTICINDTRALVSTTSPPRTLANNALVKNTEKFAVKTTTHERIDSMIERSSCEQSLYNADAECDTSLDVSQGTHPAKSSDDMVRLRGNIFIDNRSSAESPATFTDGGDSRSQQDRGGRRQTQGYIPETQITAGAAAVAAFEIGNGNRLTQTKNAALPRTKEISKAILDEMERMRTNPDINSVNLTIDLSDGNSLGMKLCWRGNGISVSFGEGSEKMRGEIENGWASLVLSAGNSGVMLESPRFDNDQPQPAATSHYA